MTVPAELPGGGVPGFSIAGGDPDALSRAAAIHSDAADMMAMHGAMVIGQAQALESDWQGQANTSYSDLSSYVHAHFNLASDGARTAASGLAQWSRDLSAAQTQGRHAMTEVEYWLKEQAAAYAALQAAEQSLTNDSASLAAMKAPNPLTGASPTSASPAPLAPSLSPSDPLSGSSITAGAISSMTGQVASDRQAVSAATARLKHATDEVLRYQALGRQAWADAIAAAKTATGTLGSINVPPPPLAGFARTEPTVTKPTPWYDTALDIAGDVLGAIGTVAGGVALYSAMIPGVGEVVAPAATLTALAADTGTVAVDWTKVAVGDNEPVPAAVVDTVLLGVAGAGTTAGDVTDSTLSGAANHIAGVASTAVGIGETGQGAASLLDGSGAAPQSPGTTAAAKVLAGSAG